MLTLKLKNASLPPATETGRLGRGFFICIALTIAIALGLTPAVQAAATIALSSSAGVGAITIAASGPNYKSSFGTMNALAVGASTTSTTPFGVALSNGALYYTTLKVTIGKLKTNPTVDTAVVKAYVSTNFTPAAAASAMQIYACPASSGCTSSSQFSVLGLSAGSAATLATGLTAQTGTSNIATVGLAIFLPDNDGSTFFTNSASATVTYEVFVNGNAAADATVTLALNNPNETVQNAVQLILAADPSGLSITAGSGYDYAMDFGNVNGLGIGSSLSTVAQAGGIIYSTPYKLQPAFTDINASSATLKVCVTAFPNPPGILSLYDSATGSAGTFSAITTTCPGSTLTTAADRAPLTRYLGLFVSNANSVSSTQLGLEHAFLTYTMTVP